MIRRSTNLMLSLKQDTPLKMSYSASATSPPRLLAVQVRGSPGPGSPSVSRPSHLLIMIYILPYSAAATAPPRLVPLPSDNMGSGPRLVSNQTVRRAKTLFAWSLRSADQSPQRWKSERDAHTTMIQMSFPLRIYSSVTASGGRSAQAAPLSSVVYRARVSDRPTDGQRGREGGRDASRATTAMCESPRSLGHSLARSLTHSLTHSDRRSRVQNLLSSVV